MLKTYSILVKQKQLISFSYCRNPEQNKCLWKLSEISEKSENEGKSSFSLFGIKCDLWFCRGSTQSFHRSLCSVFPRFLEDLAARIWWGFISPRILCLCGFLRLFVVVFFLFWSFVFLGLCDHFASLCCQFVSLLW